jgi:hypothetical protein
VVLVTVPIAILPPGNKNSKVLMVLSLQCCYRDGILQERTDSYVAAAHSGDAKPATFSFWEI